jgi:hypothetical protein
MDTMTDGGLGIGVSGTQSNSRGLDGEMSKNADFLLRIGYQEGKPSPKE